MPLIITLTVFSVVFALEACGEIGRRPMANERSGAITAWSIPGKSAATLMWTSWDNSPAVLTKPAKSDILIKLSIRRRDGMADVTDSKSVGATRVGSSPTAGTNLERRLRYGSIAMGVLFVVQGFLQSMGFGRASLRFADFCR